MNSKLIPSYPLTDKSCIVLNTRYEFTLDSYTGPHSQNSGTLAFDCRGKEYITKCEEVIFEQQCAEPGAKENHRPNLVLQYIEHDKPEVIFSNSRFSY